MQKPHPPIYLTGTSGAGFGFAAKKGWAISIGGPAPDMIFEKGIQAYRDACALYGTVPRISYIRAVYIEEDPIVAKREIEKALLNFFRFNASPMAALEGEAIIQQLKEAGYAFYASDALRELAAMDYEALIETGIAFVGSPQKIADQFTHIIRKFDPAEIVIMSHFGDIEPWKAIKTQERFIKEVVPLLS